MNESINKTIQTPAEKKLKLTQISKYLSPAASTSQKLADLSSQEYAQNQTSKKKLTKSKSGKLKFSKLNDSKCLDESITIGENKYFQKKTSASLNTSTTESTCEQVSTNSSESKFNCPICSTDITNLTDRQSHVNQCLDKGFSKNSKSKSTKPFIPPAVDSAKPNEADKQKKFTQLMIEDAVPNCPICGKEFRTLNSRQNHLKKCAQVFHIKTESLFELVKKQQVNLERDLAKGLVPTDVYFIKRKPEKPKNVEAQAQPCEPKPKKETKAQKKKQQILKDSVLRHKSDEDRKEVLASRFASILSKNKIVYGARVRSDGSTPLVKTKFKSDDNYLWNRCKYFDETEDQFYVKVFLDSGKFMIGQQVFIQKLNESKFENVELLNTQTALLLAELNDQSTENISIYYSQTQKNLDYTQLNLTTSADNLIMNESRMQEFNTLQDVGKRESLNKFSSQIKSQQWPEENSYWQPNYCTQMSMRAEENFAGDDLVLEKDTSNDKIIEENENYENENFNEPGTLENKDKFFNESDTSPNSPKETSNLPESSPEVKNLSSSSQDSKNSPNCSSVSVRSPPNSTEDSNSPIKPMNISTSPLKDNNSPVGSPDLFNSIKMPQITIIQRQVDNELGVEKSRVRQSHLTEKLEEAEDNLSTDSCVHLDISEDIPRTHQTNTKLLADTSSNDSIKEIPPEDFAPNSSVPKQTALTSLFDSSSNEEDTVVYEARKQNFCLKDIYGDDDAMSRKSIEGSVISPACLIDETLLSSDLSETEKEVTLLSDQLSSRETDTSSNSNILDQNVLMDETCLDESLTSLNSNNLVDRHAESEHECSSNDRDILSELRSVSFDSEIKYCSQRNRQSLGVKRKSIEVIQIGSDSSDSKFGNLSVSGDAKKFKKSEEITVVDAAPVLPEMDSDSASVLPLMNNDSTSELASLNNEPREQCPELDAQDCENQIIDDVWDNFGGQDQFDDYYQFEGNGSVVDYRDELDEIKPGTCSQSEIAHTSITGPELFTLENQNQAKDDLVNFNLDDHIETKNQLSISNHETSKYDTEFECTLVNLETNSPKDTDNFLKRQKYPGGETNRIASVCSEQTLTPKLDIGKKPKKMKRIPQHLKEDSSSLTPMADYAAMNTPTLKAELKKYGVKPLSKKQSVKKLVEIYEFTHKNKLKRSTSCMDLKTIQAPDVGKKKLLKKSESSLDLSNIVESENCGKKVSKPKKMLKKQISEIGLQSKTHNEKNSELIPSTKQLVKIGSKPPKIPTKTSSTGQHELTIVEHLNALGEADTDDDDDSTSCSTQSLFSSQKTKKIAKNLDEIELRDYVSSFIRNDEEIYLSVLNYVPLDIENIHSRLQALLAPRRANNKLLMKILDEFCVTFTMKNCSTKTHQGKPKYQKKH